MTRGDLATKVALVRDNLEKLQGLPTSSLESFQADFRNLAAAHHCLQTAIQALLDIGGLAIATRGLPPPRTSLEILQTLEDAQALPQGSTLRFRPLVGFRNRIVHLYDRTDPAIVLNILQEDLDDLRELLSLLLDALDTSPDA